MGGSNTPDSGTDEAEKLSTTAFPEALSVVVFFLGGRPGYRTCLTPGRHRRFNLLGIQGLKVDCLSHCRPRLCRHHAFAGLPSLTCGISFRRIAQSQIVLCCQQFPKLHQSFCGLLAVRIRINCPREVLTGLQQITLLSKCEADSRRGIGFTHRLPQSRHGRRNFANVNEGYSKVGLGSRMRRINLLCPAENLDSFLCFALQVMQYPRSHNTSTLVGDNS